MTSRAAADELQRLHGEADTAAKMLRQATRHATADLMALRGALAGADTAKTRTEDALASARGGSSGR